MMPPSDLYQKHPHRKLGQKVLLTAAGLATAAIAYGYVHYKLGDQTRAPVPAEVTPYDSQRLR